MSSSDTPILEFTVAEDIAAWRPIDDRIMGGVSQSHAEFAPGNGLRFTGTVSLENNGGFASIRSPENNYDLGRCSGLRLRVCGDGHRYKLGLRTDRFFDGVSYQAEFATGADTWQEILLPFDGFMPTHHGIRLTTVAPLDPSHIQSFGLFIAGGQEGPFRLDIAWLRGVA